MSTPDDIAAKFFAAYAKALLDRDSDALATLYAVPALIAFPQNAIPVTDQEQTREFFDKGWSQYEGVEEAHSSIDVLAATKHSIWADVAWSYGGAQRERFVYQLLNNGTDWQVAVLTPLEADD